jgi:diguanylate cyclase (GGDEF)-like protein
MPGSVVVYLLGLTLTPVLALLAVGGIPLRDVIRGVAATQEIESTMRRVRSFDDLRVALLDEMKATVVDRSARAMGMSPAAVDGLAGFRISVPLPVALTRTDRTTGRLVDDPATARIGRSVASRLGSVRRSTGSVSGRTLAEMMQQSTGAIDAYGDLIDEISEAEEDAAVSVITGRHGQVDSGLLQAGLQINLVTTFVVSQEARRASDVYTLTVRSGAERQPVRDDIRRLTAAHSVTRHALDKTFGAGESPWARFRRAPATTRFNSLVAEVLAPTRAASGGGIDTLRVIRYGRIVNEYNEEQSRLQTRTVELGVSSAAANRTATLRHARDVVVTMVVAVLATALLLVTIGGAIRRRLNRLATAAQRLSSGRLENVAIRGPREIELAGKGLDDAASSLRGVIASAERLVAGDLADYRPVTPLQGELGRSVHEAFNQVVEVMRERERLQVELAHQASHDGLTGLVNRAEGERLLEQALRAARDAGDRVAVLFIDLDHFKLINDTHGHAAGDHVLGVSAERMVAQARAGDVVCRLGGDEFIVVIPRVADPRAPRALAERIVTGVSTPIPWAGVELSVGACVGIAVCDAEIDVDEILLRADRAVYAAKAAGRGRVHLVDSREDENPHRTA